MENQDLGTVVDLFCGIGGLSHGLIKEGFNVVAGIDNDLTCKYGYEKSNKTRFIHKDIVDVSCEEIRDFFSVSGRGIKILVGCAPCQPFSKLNMNRANCKDMMPLERFSFLIDGVKPDIVVMENVMGLANYEVFPAFKTLLDTLTPAYDVHYEIVDMSEYGIPQNRKRLVFLASKFGKIDLIDATHRHRKNTVRDVIDGCEPLEAGETSSIDFLHRACVLSPLNLRRIRATPHDGGSATSWDEELLLDCYKKDSGKTYMRSVYGRMRWNNPSPTITTQFMRLGTGRYGHPEQDRAISFREAALLQTFPLDYIFQDPEDPVVLSRLARHIGNAVPVEFGAVLGRSIKKHLKHHAK